MALARKYQKIFGKNADATDLGVVGSKTEDNPQYSADVETLQSLSNWETGLRAIVTNSIAPYLQDHNSIFYVITSQLAYLFQAGIAEWNSQTEYVANRSVVLKSGKIYMAIANNTNVEPEVTASWDSYWLCINYWGGIQGDIYNQTDLWQILSKGLSYNNTVSTAINGYPQGTRLNFVDSSGNTIIVESLINGNTHEPSMSNILFDIDDENYDASTYFWKADIQKKVRTYETIGITKYALSHLSNGTKNTTYTTTKPTLVIFGDVVGSRHSGWSCSLQVSTDNNTWITIGSWNVADGDPDSSPIYNTVIGKDLYWKVSISLGSYTLKYAPLY